MPTILFQILTISADLVLFIFIGFYLFSLHRLETRLKKKEAKIDTDYHQIIDNALTRERKIMEDAVAKANQIISESHYINQTYTQELNDTFIQMSQGIKRYIDDTSKRYLETYENYLREVAIGSLDNFQGITHRLETDLQTQIKQFNQTLASSIEKSASEYKQMRLKQAEASIQRIVQTASKEILNKSISLDNHHDLVVAALERAKQEGILD